MVEFNDITLSAGKQKKRGTLSWTTTTAPTSIDFRSKASNKPISIRLSDITSFSWSQQFDGYQWKIGLQGGTIVKFAGFQESAYKDIESLANDRKLIIQKEIVSTKGANAGKLEITGEGVGGTVIYLYPAALQTTLRSAVYWQPS